MDIYLTGYKYNKYSKNKHTNFWPWSYLTKTFNQLGYNAYHLNPNKINNKKPNIYICWNNPDSVELIKQYDIHKDSIIIQKLTAFDSGRDYNGLDIMGNPIEFFKNWNWPQYKKLEKLEKIGVRFYAFGCKTEINAFPEKKRIISKYSEKIFWIPWGSMTIPYKKIIRTKSMNPNYKYDLGFVGSRWGKGIRGNMKTWDEFLGPLISDTINSKLAGDGTTEGPVSIRKHINILKNSSLCPIIHAPCWKAEKGIMDRFWTVFSLGKFGVCDNEGILYYYNEDEVVLATDKDDYYEKSKFYINNPDKQRPYIEKALKRIHSEYAQYIVWGKILKQLFEKEKLSI